MARQSSTNSSGRTSPFSFSQFRRSFLRSDGSAAAATAGDCATYRKIVDAECADACLPDPVGICPRSIVVSSGGLDGGACKDLNYTQADGTTSQSAGPCGTLNFNKWKKP